ncbi:hypothetical protein ACW7GZ_00005, partial [Luteimonas sp. A537]
MRLVGGTLLRTSAAALIGASATGVGIVLFIVGVAWALYAASLEHDENEKFPDRSFFGRHKSTEGRFGGTQMDNPDAWGAHGLDDELLAMGVLAIEREINDRKYQAVRLVFALHNKGENDPIAQAEVW